MCFFIPKIQINIKWYVLFMWIIPLIMGPLSKNNFVEVFYIITSAISLVIFFLFSFKTASGFFKLETYYINTKPFNLGLVLLTLNPNTGICFLTGLKLSPKIVSVC